MSLDRPLLWKSLWFFVIAALFNVLAVAALCNKWGSGWSLAFIVLIDAYFLLAVFSAALLSDGLAKGHKIVLAIFPNRSIGLIICVLLWVATIVGFAAVYTNSGDQNFSKPFNAIHFSIITLMTAGYGEIQPPKGYRGVVTFEMITGFIFLIGIFPLVLSRITDFDGGSPKEGE